jgi:hypothetical protein
VAFGKVLHNDNRSFNVVLVSQSKTVLYNAIPYI